MKNITVTLPEETARWVRVRAAENERSVSRWLADLIEDTRRHDDEYEVAMRSFLARKPRKLHWIDGRRPTRDEIHDRPVLRWERKPAVDGRSVSGAHRREPTGDAEA